MFEKHTVTTLSDLLLLWYDESGGNIENELHNIFSGTMRTSMLVRLFAGHDPTQRSRLYYCWFARQ
jgi:hypothetical protein